MTTSTTVLWGLWLVMFSILLLSSAHQSSTHDHIYIKTGLVMIAIFCIFKSTPQRRRRLLHIRVEWKWLISLFPVCSWGWAQVRVMPGGLAIGTVEGYVGEGLGMQAVRLDHTSRVGLVRFATVVVQNLFNCFLGSQPDQLWTMGSQYATSPALISWW